MKRDAVEKCQSGGGTYILIISPSPLLLSRLEFSGILFRSIESEKFIAGRDGPEQCHYLMFKFCSWSD